VDVMVHGLGVHHFRFHVFVARNFFAELF